MSGEKDIMLITFSDFKAHNPNLMLSTDLGKHFQNVESIEMTNYNFPNDAGVTYHAKTVSAPGNNLLDVKMVDPDGVEDDLEFTVVLPVDILYTSIQQHSNIVRELLQTTMDEQGDSYFNSANDVFWIVIFNENFRGSRENKYILCI